MSDAYIIEVGDEAAGIVVRDGRRFRFVSSSRRFTRIDGEFYRTPQGAERAARGVLTAQAAPSAAGRMAASAPGPR